MPAVRTFVAAQTVPLAGDVDANLQQHIDLVHAAGDAEPDVVVFPELSLTGYELDRAIRHAFEPDDARLEPLRVLAERYDTTIVVGAPVRIAPDLHIGAFIISPNGIDVYTKQRVGAFPSSAGPNGSVPPREDSVFVPGDRDPSVPLASGTAAVAICADIGRASHAAEAAARGADVYLACMFVIPAELDRDVARLRSYAAKHRMAVVFANFGGPSGGLPSAGRSAIWSPGGDLVVALPERGTGMAVASERDTGWQGQTIVGSPAARWAP